MDNFNIEAVSLNNWGIAHLVKESLGEGHRHIQRLSEDYISCRNRFSKKGEALFGQFIMNKSLVYAG